MDHIGIRAIAFGIAFKKRIPQRVNVLWHINRIAIFLHRFQRVEERFKNGKKRSGAGRARIGREIKENNRDLALSLFRAS